MRNVTTNFKNVKQSFQSLLEHVFSFYTYLQKKTYKYIPSHHNIILLILLFILLLDFFYYNMQKHVKLLYFAMV
jgi:hypothetical protein